MPSLWPLYKGQPPGEPQLCYRTAHGSPPPERGWPHGALKDARTRDWATGKFRGKLIHTFSSKEVVLLISTSGAPPRNDFELGDGVRSPCSLESVLAPLGF